MPVTLRGRHLKKSDLIEIIKRRLGYPLVKVELDETQIIDHINYTRDKWIKWGIGNAVQECWFTLQLSAGVTTYDLDEVNPSITEVIGYKTTASGTSTGGIHTLFSWENFMYNSGAYDSIAWGTGGDGYSMVSYHIARDFLETMNRYIVDSYDFTYHRYDNTLEIWPAPPSSVDNAGTPAWLLVRAYKIEGNDGDIYTNDWFLDYLTAMCKVSLGRIRTKFANFQAVGSNIGLAMDGDTLIAEGREELERLEERLRLEEVYEGGYIICG